MFKNWKFTSVSVVLLWLLFLWHVLAIEVFNLNGETWVVSAFVVCGLLIIFHVYFIYSLLKNKAKVDVLKEQYIDTLKPDKPLRFCPSDDELMKKHQEQLTSNLSEKQPDEEKLIPLDEHSNDNEELELM